MGLGDVVVRRIGVGVTIDVGMIAVGGVAIDTGKNVDVFRNDVVDEFGDNGLRWYRWRFRVCVGFAGIKMWWVGGRSGNGDDDDGRKVLPERKCCFVKTLVLKKEVNLLKLFYISWKMIN